MCVFLGFFLSQQVFLITLFLWNNLPADRQFESVESFESHLKSHLFASTYIYFPLIEHFMNLSCIVFFFFQINLRSGVLPTRLLIIATVLTTIISLFVPQAQGSNLGAPLHFFLLFCFLRSLQRFWIW